MPTLNVGGTKFNHITRAKVEVAHGEAREARQIPIHQFVVELPLDHLVVLAEWALAQQSEKRWRKVVLVTNDRGNTLNHTWTMQKAYVHKYIEREFPKNSGSSNTPGNYVEVTIRGILISNTAPDGKNILQVEVGQPEQIPTG